MAQTQRDPVAGGNRASGNVLSRKKDDPEYSPRGAQAQVEHALKLIGLAIIESPRVGSILREAAREVALAFGEMRRIGAWSPTPTTPFFQELSPAEVTQLMRIGRRP
jgi:hypothetical protein